MKHDCEYIGCRKLGRYYPIFKRVYCPEHYAMERERMESQMDETQTRLC